MNLDREWLVCFERQGTSTYIQAVFYFLLFFLFLKDSYNLKCSGVHETSHTYTNQVRPSTNIMLLELHIVIKGVALLLKTETSGNPEVFWIRLEIALGNGETCLWTYSKLKKIVKLIFIIYIFVFCSSAYLLQLIWLKSYPKCPKELLYYWTIATY